MGHPSHAPDFELDEIIEDLTDSGRLERGSAAYGVAQLVIHRGYDTLWPKQRELYDAVLLADIEAARAGRRAHS